MSSSSDYDYDFDISLDPLVDDKNECISYLASCLDGNYLSLLLGAGVSKDLNLPNWSELVLNCLKKTSPSQANKYSISKKEFTNEELKDITQSIKDDCSKKKIDYLELVHKNLYKGIKLDFRQANKGLLIALSSLVVGSTRGNVTDIVTYNFDSILEWYFSTIGLSVNLFDKKNLLCHKYDVNIIHTHGYLPYNFEDEMTSEEIIFTSEEFIDKWNNNDYLKQAMHNYLKSHVFLAIGLSPESLTNDLSPYIRDLKKWYKQEQIIRKPFGVAFLKNFSVRQKEKLMTLGIAPFKIKNYDEIPELIFRIAQEAIHT